MVTGLFGKGHQVCRKGSREEGAEEEVWIEHSCCKGLSGARNEKIEGKQTSKISLLWEGRKEDFAREGEIRKKKVNKKKTEEGKAISS